MDDPILLVEAFRQAGSTSAVLGGLAFTAAAAVLSASVSGSAPLGKPSSLTAGASTASAASLIVSSLAWSQLATKAVAFSVMRQPFDVELLWVSRSASLAFALGLILLFVAIGASGWIGSRKLGLFTSTVAALGGTLALVLELTFAS